MKGNNPRITLLGSNSGNNLGDAAILSGILDILTHELPDAEFYVPSTNPGFIDRNYGDRYRVRGVNVMPWTGSIRLFGIPTAISLFKSDVALICDGIIFGKKFFNPAFNFLITLVFLVPIAKLFRCKLVCYSCGIGPFPVPMSRRAARYVINACDLVIMRENDSKALARELGVTKDILVTGDAAFINPVNGDDRALVLCKEKAIATDKPLFGVNVTSYIDGWLASDKRLSDKNTFLTTLEEAIRAANEACGNGFQPVFFSTHPMDEAFSQKLADRLNAPLLHNSEYLSHDIQAVMARCELFMGMRFHSLVLASAVGAPLIGLIYAPKVRGYMRLLECEHLGLELVDLTPEGLAKTIEDAWKQRKELKVQQQKIVAELIQGAKNAAKLLRERFFSEAKAPQNEALQQAQAGKF